MAWSPIDAPSIVSSGRSRSGSGHVRDRRRAQEADHRARLVGQLGRPVAIAAHGVGAELGREQQRPGVDIGHLDQLEVQRGDDRVGAAAAAQGPEQLRVVVGVDGPLLAVRGHQLERPNLVAGPAVTPPEPAQAAAEGVAGDADVRRGAGQKAEPVLLRGGAQVHRQDPGADPGGAPLRVDLDPAQALGLDHDRALERAHRHGAVAGPLAEQLEVVVAGEADHGGDVGGALDEGDRLRVRVGGQVPRLAGLVPVRVLGGRDPSVDAELAEIHA